MTEPVRAFPLQWPPGWKRAHPIERTRARFLKKTRTPGESWTRNSDLSVSDSTKRLRLELERMGVDREDVVISTNMPVRLDGLPRSDARNPDDPGAAVYWRDGNATRCMAIDRYDRVSDNLAAIAATLEAMRAIERHGGAAILDRAFTGFAALPAPEQWFEVLDVPAKADKAQIEAAHRRLAMQHHPDRGGTGDRMSRINTARDDGLAQVRQ